MELAYKFTPEERRVVANAFNRYLQVIQVIADLHPEALQGESTVAPDGSGFLKNDRNQEGGNH